MLTDIRADKDQANDGLSSSLLILYLDSARNLPVGNAMGTHSSAHSLGVDLAVFSHAESPVLVAVIFTSLQPERAAVEMDKCVFASECNFLFTHLPDLSRVFRMIFTLTCFMKKSPTHRKRICLVFREEVIL